MVSAGRYRRGLTSDEAHSCIADGEHGEVAGQLYSSVAGADGQLQSRTYDELGQGHFEKTSVLLHTSLSMNKSFSAVTLSAHTWPGPCLCHELNITSVKKTVSNTVGSISYLS